MDDLAGLDWSAPSKPTPNPPPAASPFRQSPAPQLSARSTPLSAQPSGSNSLLSRGVKAPSKPGTPANDSFAGLVSLNTSKPATSHLSLQERQKQLQEEKQRQEAERRKQLDAQFGAHESKFWDSLGTSTKPSGPAPTEAPPPRINVSGAQSLSKTINKPFANLSHHPTPPRQPSPAEADLLSAFNSAAPVDSSSHFPPPLQQRPTNPTYDDDDDIFGLSQLRQKPTGQVQNGHSPANDDDDDILGVLAKPVSEFQKPQESPPAARDEDTHGYTRPATEISPHDKAVAELVDMGFPAEKAAIALAQTDSGTDIQAAVGLLLNQAHAEAKQKTQGRSQSRGRLSPAENDERSRRGQVRPSRDSSTNEPVPAWMKGTDSRNRSAQRGRDNESPHSEKDVSQYASEIGTTLFKSANSLWKAGQKKVQKAVGELQQDGDPNVPKWMRSAQPAPRNREVDPRDESRSSASRSQRDTLPVSSISVTDEALMLEAGSRPAKPPRPSSHQTAEPRGSRHPREQLASNNPFSSRISTSSSSESQRPQYLDSRSTSKLSRQDVEQQSAQAYVSPARRKKPSTPANGSVSQRPSPSTDSSRQSTPAPSNNSLLQQVTLPQSRPAKSTPPAVKPRRPPRQIPPVSPSALSSSAAHRGKGSDAFKRGDYSAAHESYTAALAPLPQNHPVAIIVLCNRAVTGIKVGDPKGAVADADAALAIIGTSKGVDEKIVLGGAEGEKEMREFFGKALMRKAEALEHMEKWADAVKVWKEAVEAGVGGSVSIQGRNRCEKAAGGGAKSAASAAPKRPPPRKPNPPKASALADLGGGPKSEAEAVTKLRAANAAAEKADDEKFALSDQVEAKLVAWKGTKSDNLRALLGSLDKVLWPEAGWNKVNMGDLVMPNKVKIIYMKAIAKVHPDKVSQTATTEQRMISAAVFSTLNEAWDKFKQDNGL